MRLVGQILRYFQTSHIGKPPKCINAQVRYKHRPPPKKLQEVTHIKSECLEPCKVPGKKSIWNIFSRNKKKDLKCFEKEKKHPKLCETVEYVSEKQAECDMQNIARMGGKVYRTCGSAYILQKDHQAPEMPEPTTSSEARILEEMMKDPSLKGQCDPMPPYQSAEMRLIELSDRKLHPLYKKLMSIPKKPNSCIPTCGVASGGATAKAKAGSTDKPYQTRSGPITQDELPPHLKISRECFEKKNIIYDYKRYQPPQQLLAKLVEMKKNERPRFGKKPQEPQKPDCSIPSKLSASKSKKK